MWYTLKKPILALAPLDDVTDVVFRQIICEVGKPDLLFTEFTNVDALCSKGRASQERRLAFMEDQRPIVAQIWGSRPENFRTVACELVERGFDGVDINMGCPDKRFVGSGLCAGLIGNRGLATEIIQATKEGASRHPDVLCHGELRRTTVAQTPNIRSPQHDNHSIPISVKTRIGIRKPVTESWIQFLLEQNVAAIIVHGRTVKEMSKVPADWGEIAKAAAVRNESGKETLIIGNGDVTSRRQAFEYAKTYGVDGIMIGRVIFDNPWFFHPNASADQIPQREKLRLFSRHIQLWKETYGDSRPFEILKKFAKVYISGFDGASNIRQAIMATGSLTELEEVIRMLLL